MKQEVLKPYSVSQGEEATDWWAELTILKELELKGEGNWTEEEREKVLDLERQAGQWVTCACGNMCSILPRDDMGMPLDAELADLGCDFSAYIDEHWLDVDAAVGTLERIEKRSAELINDIRRNERSKTD